METKKVFSTLKRYLFIEKHGPPNEYSAVLSIVESWYQKNFGNSESNIELKGGTELFSKLWKIMCRIFELELLTKRRF